MIQTAPTETYTRAFLRGLKPTERLLVSEWADKYRIIPQEGGSKEPGKWRTSRFPFLKEPMDNLSTSSPVQFTIIIAGTQVGKTECGMNFLGHTIQIDPSNFMILMPTLNLAHRRSTTKVKHTIEQTPELASRVAKARERDSDNTTLKKGYPGGTLIISGANSAASLSDFSAKKLHMDEVDRYELDLEKEGDTISLALKRTDSFGDEKKILITSTPTIKGFSIIEREFENSDQRHFYVPCPFCGHMQHLRWKDGKWNGDGDYRIIFTQDAKGQIVGPVTYKCEACEKLIPEHHKTEMLAAGEWRAHNPGHRRRGYKLPSFYSPLGFLSWEDIAQEFLDAKHERDIEKLKTWKNTRLAETWDEEDDPNLEDANNVLLARRENYGPVVPMQGLFLVAGADVQRDRIEINVAAYGQGEECFNMEYRVIPGSIADKHVQQDLDDYLFAPWLHASGAPMTISATLIDSGDGVNAQEIYDYVKPRQRRGVYASKGSQFARKPIVERSKKANQGGIRHYNIGTDTAKDSIFSRIAIPKADQIEAETFKPLTPEPVEISPMFVHWNMSGYDEEYFLQFFSEVVKKEKKGRKYVRYYKQIRERNEALDTAVLCLAAIRLRKPNWKMIIERLAKKAKAAGMSNIKKPVVSQIVEVEDHIPDVGNMVEQTTEKPTKPARRVVQRRSGWVSNW